MSKKINYVALMAALFLGLTIGTRLGAAFTPVGFMGCVIYFALLAYRMKGIYLNIYRSNEPDPDEPKKERKAKVIPFRR